MITNRDQLKFMVKYLRIHKATVTFLFLLILSNIFLQIYSPHYIQTFIDSAKAGKETSVLMLTALIFFVLTIIRQFVIIVIQYLTSDVTWKISNLLRQDLTRLILHFDLSFHNQHTPGEMVDRIDGDVGKLNNFLSAFALKVISNNLLIIGIIIVIFSINFQIGIVVTLLSILGLTVLNRMGAFGTRTIRNYMAESSDLIGYLDERIAGREDIRALNAESYMMRVYYKKLQSLYRLRNRTGFRIGTVLNAGEMVLALIMAITILAMGFLFLYNAKLSTGTMFLIYYYITILLIPLKNIAAEASDQQQVKAALLRINELLTYKSKVDTSGQYQMTDQDLSIRFKHVSFSYDGMNKVLHDVSFHIPANKTIGILGKTGSGKSTIARLMYRLCDAEEGTIEINGIDSKHIELDNLRMNVGIISQNIEIFEGTLRDNITMYKEQITDKEIWQIIDRLCLSEWIKGFSEGLDQKIAGDGKNLSAGESQLIVLVRAFLKTPKIVILDEATSRIDPLTEQIMEKAMAAFIQGRTAPIIAHRLSTIKETDYLLVMHNGSVIEFGETKLLAQNPLSEYAKILQQGGDLHA